MFCETYNQSLSAAAANSELLSPALRQHLASCTSCRDAFAEEQSLFVAIDAGLQVAANSEVPATLIPRVRVALNNEPAPQGRGFNFLLWSFAGASVTAAVVLALLYLPHKRTTLPSESARTVALGTAQNAPNRVELNPVPTGGVSTLRHKKAAVLAANQIAKPELPEVLVPPEEKAAFVRYEESLRRKQGMVFLASVKSDGVPREIEPLRIPEIEFVDLKIPVLSQGNSEDDTK